MTRYVVQSDFKYIWFQNITKYLPTLNSMHTYTHMHTPKTHTEHDLLPKRFTHDS